MRKPVRIRSVILRIVACASTFALTGSFTLARPQDQSSGTRQILPEEFIKSRPAGSGAASRAHLHYARVGSPIKLAAADSPADLRQLGVTIWRLRPSLTSDRGARILVQEGPEAIEWTPERVTAETPLRQGERVRLSIESKEAGYLYVVDREEYADGTYGAPYLIFPTTRTLNGKNDVAAGRLIDIPGQEDRPNYFTVRTSRAGQTGELLTLLVLRQPISGLSLGPKPLALSDEQVAQWEKEWSAPVERFELTGGKGKTWTKAEQQAGANSSRLLTQDDPGPQTIFRVVSAPNKPILVKLRLNYGHAGAPHPTARSKSTAAKTSN